MIKSFPTKVSKGLKYPSASHHRYSQLWWLCLQQYALVVWFWPAWGRCWDYADNSCHIINYTCNTKLRNNEYLMNLGTSTTAMVHNHTNGTDNTSQLQNYKQINTKPHWAYIFQHIQYPKHFQSILTACTYTTTTNTS